MGGGGGGSPRALDKGGGGAGLQKNYSALLFGLKISGERAPRAPLLDPPLTMLYMGFT